MPSNQLIVLPSAPDTSESYSAADEEILRAISRAQENLLRQQKPDGHWCGELMVDSTLCSDYVVFMGNARVLRDAAADAGLEAFGGVNAPYIWVKTPEGLTSWQLFDRMLRELNVVITPGAGFGAQGEGYFRISAFNSSENAEEVARRLKSLRSA